MDHQSRIIFVEGIPFTGKSTTSEYLTAQLTLNGYPAKWLPEDLTLQRFPRVMAALDRQEPLALPTLRAEWRGFVEAVLADDTIIVSDSALSSPCIAALLTENLPEAVIADELRHIAELCAPLAPYVIHLTGDVARLVEASIEGRGPGWETFLVQIAEAAPYQQARDRTGVAGAIGMLHDEQDLHRATLARDGWQTLTLDVTAPDWTAHQHAILDFLGLEEMKIVRPALAQSVLESYIGRYVPDDPARVTRVIWVQMEHETLALRGPDRRYGTLVPITDTRFHLQATSLDLEFVVEGGLVRQLTVLQPDGTRQSYQRT